MGLRKYNQTLSFQRKNCHAVQVYTKYLYKTNAIMVAILSAVKNELNSTSTIIISKISLSSYVIYLSDCHKSDTVVASLQNHVTWP